MSGNKDSEIVDHADATDGLSQQRLRNKMAQRKYRMKLKQRIEDLEKRAASCNDAGNSQTAIFHNLAQVGNEQESSLHQATVPLQAIPVPPLTEPLFDGKQRSLSKLMERDTLQNQHFNHAMTYDFRLPSPPALDGWQDAPDLSHSEFLTTDSNGGAASRTYLFNPLPSSCGKPPPSRSRKSNPSFSDKSTAEVDYILPDKAHGTIGSNTISNPSITTEDPGRIATQSEKMKLVLDSTRSAGFDTFDSVVVEYYTEEFEKGTNVHNAQKMSRHRHLPNVLRSLRHSAGQWTQWEAGGYKGEIIRSAETILVEEFERLMHNQVVGACSENDTSSAASGNLSPRPSPTGSSTDSEPTSILNGTLKIEDELPNLWSLVIALTSGGSSSTQSTRYQVLLDCLHILDMAKSSPRS